MGIIHFLKSLFATPSKDLGEEIDPKDLAKIQRDLKKIRSRIKELKRHPWLNYRVIKKNYTSPKMKVGDKVNLRKGEHAYLMGLRDLISSFLSSKDKDSFKAALKEYNAPKYLLKYAV